MTKYVFGIDIGGTTIKMGLFDNLKRQAMNKVNTSGSQAINSLANAAGNAVRNMGNKKETFTFTAIPSSLNEFTALPYADLSTP
ncbi:MAG: ROK family protein, partial [Lachnospiraceae bacterium]|nr:ROK family protein [Lachnospiraceae bacterium]